MSEKDDEKWGWKDALLTAVFVFALIGVVCTAQDCVAERSINRDLARNTQRCDVDGQQFGCVRDTAWWDGSRCSCALPGGRRIEYRLSRDERGE